MKRNAGGYAPKHRGCGNTLMSPHLKRYSDLELRLLELRKTHRDEDPPGADDILDEMEEVWSLLSDVERKKLKEGPSRTFPSSQVQ